MADFEILTAEEIAELQKWDTPSVCNALEILCPERRTRGYTVENLICSFPELPPMVGYARCWTIRAMHKPEVSPEEMKERRLACYEYVQNGPKPAVMCIHDLDPIKGYGSFWGEVQSNVHKGLGAVGVVTDGCIRDIDAWAKGFQALSGSIKPSHSWVHVVDFDIQIDVCGMEVKTNDLVHADRHGAVVIPHDVARKVADTCAMIGRKEEVVISAAQRPGFSVDDLREAFKKQEDIH